MIIYKSPNICCRGYQIYFDQIYFYIFTSNQKNSSNRHTVSGIPAIPRFSLLTYTVPGSQKRKPVNTVSRVFLYLFI